MEYGDGTVETRTIPAASTFSTFSFSHSFPAQTATYTQRATIVETGQYGEAITRVNRPQPELIPPEQTADPYGLASYDVRVPGDPSGETTLRMEFGDGAVETRVIPASSDFSTFHFDHSFPWDNTNTYAQRATIVETAEYDDAVTYVNGTNRPDPG